MGEVEEAKVRYEAAKKAKSDSDAQLKKLQQANKVSFFFISDLLVYS